MRKIKFLFIFLCLFVINNAFAVSISASISCPASVYAGENIICKINANASDGFLDGIKANFVIENGTYVSFAGGSSWAVWGNTPSGFVLGNTSGGVTNNTNLGTLTIKPNGGVGSSVAVKLTRINASDVTGGDHDLPDKSVSVSVVEKPVVKPPENNNTQNNNTQNESGVSQKKEEVFLDSLTVEGYTLLFNKNVYEYNLEVEDTVQSIVVNASSKNNKVTGTGTLKLENIENKFKIVVKGKETSKTYTLNVKKLENISDTPANDASSVEKSLSKYDLVNINLDKNNGDITAFQSVVDKVKGQNKKIVYNIYDGEKLLYSYIFDGSNMDFVLGDINLGVNFSSERIDNKDTLVIDTNYKSYFPKGTILKIYNVNNNKKDMKLYRVNEEDVWELKKSKLDLNDKTISLELEKGDLYVVDNVSNSPDYSSVMIAQTIVIILVLMESIYVTYKYIKLKRKN